MKPGLLSLICDHESARRMLVISLLSNVLVGNVIQFLFLQGAEAELIFCSYFVHDFIIIKDSSPLLGGEQKQLWSSILCRDFLDNGILTKTEKRFYRSLNSAIMVGLRKHYFSWISVCCLLKIVFMLMFKLLYPPLLQALYWYSPLRWRHCSLIEQSRFLCLVALPYLQKQALHLLHCL